MSSHQLPRSPKLKDRRISLSPITAVMLLLLNIGIIGGLGWLFWQSRLAVASTTPKPSASARSIATLTQTTEPSETPIVVETPTEPPTPQVIVITATPDFSVNNTIPGLLVYAASDAGYTHLFAYHPESLPPTRLTSGNWDDRDPALSPDGTRVVFSSRRSGEWDLHMLDLTNGTVTQLTSDLAFDAAPAWSPDGEWLAYQKFVDNNLEIYIQPVDNSLDAIRVTINAAADYAPSWASDNTHIAFTSNRTGADDIWLADITQIGQEGFLINLTQNSTIDQAYPKWSPDGTKLAWIAPYEGFVSIYTGSIKDGELIGTYLGTGSFATWDPTGEFILADLASPDKHFLAIYSVADRSFKVAPQSIPGRFKGASWSPYALPGSLPAPLAEIAAEERVPTWAVGLTPSPGTVFGRQLTIDLPDVSAPHPSLNALVIESFYALRTRLTEETGWDVLSDLENAFVPLTQPLPPNRHIDWLYTGRAFAVHPSLINLGWMVVIREDFGAQTYWRIYVKARYQDGSQGEPISQRAWNFQARFSGNTTSYEEGGAYEDFAPIGYWVDLTDLAIEYGWERQPALTDWRSFYQAARYNVFAITSGLDWETAMLQIYPPEVFSDK